MTPLDSQVRVLAGRQFGAVAVWQLRLARLTEHHTREALRGLRRVFRGVCAIGDLDENGWFMAAALAMGPSGAVSHESALMLLGLREYREGDIHVSHTGGNRVGREGLVPHRRRSMETGLWNGVIPVTSPTQSLLDAGLPPHELYHAIDRAQTLGYRLNLPLDEVVRLQQSTRGRTKSVAEARFLLLAAEHLPSLPRVNGYLNGFETDFHWPDRRLVVEVDGWEFHQAREQFEEDRRRTLIHAAAGWTVLRPSASHVEHRPDLVLASIRAAAGW